MIIAIDCEMVEVSSFTGGTRRSALARVALVDDKLHCIYDKYVSPSDTVTDFRTEISGIRESDLRNAPRLSQVKREVLDLISGCLLVGHSVANDLKMLELEIPDKNIRDVAEYPTFKKYNNGDKPSLKFLAQKVLREDIQTGQHNPVEDAKTAMKLYKSVAQQWQ